MLLLPLSTSRSNSHLCDDDSTKSSIKTSNIGTTPMGLRILINQSSRSSSNIVVFKPSNILHSTQFSASNSHEEHYYNHSCFLKTCYLCSKHLSPQMDVYMYRGEQGFCSVECRSRQIFLDEMEELEAATKETLRAYRSRHCQSKKGRLESDGRWRGIWAAPYSN